MYSCTHTHTRILEICGAFESTSRSNKRARIFRFRVFLCGKIPKRTNNAETLLKISSRMQFIIVHSFGCLFRVFLCGWLSARVSASASASKSSWASESEYVDMWEGVCGCDAHLLVRECFFSFAGIFLASVCIYMICVNEKPERTDSFLLRSYCCCYCCPFLSSSENLIQNTRYSKPSASFSHSVHVHVKSSKEKLCISCPSLGILIAKRPVAFSFPHRKQDRKKEIRTI